MSDEKVNSGNPGAPPAPWYAEFADWPTVSSNGWDKMEPAAAAASIAKSYRELQKLHGGITADQVVRIPDPGSPNAAEQAAAFWERMGRPKDATGYNLADVQGVPEGLLEAAKAAGLNSNMPASMLLQFMQGISGHFASQAAAAQASTQATAMQQRAALDAEWGANAGKNRWVASRAMDYLGITPEQIAALESVPGVGYAGVYKMLHKLGTDMGEARFVSGNSNPPGVLSPQQAQDKLTALLGSESWQKRAYSNNEIVRQEALRERADLARIVAGG